MSKIAIIIPARKASERLPNKMLAKIGNKPMVCHVADRALESGIGDVYVATDSTDIQSVCENNNVNCILTGEHRSGTDRIYEVLQKIDPQKKYEFVINLQGDVPFIGSHLIKNLVDKIEHSDADILTLASKLDDHSFALDPNVVNIAISFYDQQRKFGKALYFSRHAIPHGARQFYEHIGIYLYRRAALERFISITDSELEMVERLEQLRALEHHMKIDVCIVDETPSNVDTEKDLEQARRFYEANNPSTSQN